MYGISLFQTVWRLLTHQTSWPMWGGGGLLHPFKPLAATHGYYSTFPASWWTSPYFKCWPGAPSVTSYSALHILHYTDLLPGWQYASLQEGHGYPLAIVMKIILSHIICSPFPQPRAVGNISYILGTPCLHPVIILLLCFMEGWEKPKYSLQTSGKSPFPLNSPFIPTGKGWYWNSSWW